MRQIIAEGLKEIYFRDSGSRALGLSDVALKTSATSTSTTTATPYPAGGPGTLPA
jgi:hypothetical protein